MAELDQDEQFYGTQKAWPFRSSVTGELRTNPGWMHLARPADRDRSAYESSIGT